MHPLKHNNHSGIAYKRTVLMFVPGIILRIYKKARKGFLLLSFLPLASQAALPNAGQAIRDLENARPSLPAPVKLQSPEPLDNALPEDEPHAPRIPISGFIISGNKSIPSKEILPLLSEFNARSLSLLELKNAAQRVTLYYRERGYVLATAYLPKQEIAQGIVRIAVIEGHYGTIKLHNSSHVRKGVLWQPLSNLKSGMPVMGAPLERSLLLLSDIPGAQVNSLLVPGAQPGTTDLQIEATPAPWLNGSLQADNYGDVYSGEYRGGATFSINSPLRQGDRLDLRLLSSNAHQRYYRLAYQLPVGPWSTRTGAFHSDMRYKLGKDFSELRAHGSASIRGAYISQPLLRSRALNINAMMQFENKRLQDDIDLFDSRSGKRIDLWTIEINANAQDRLLGGGQSAASLAYGLGSLRLEDPYLRGWDRFTAKTEGRFNKLAFSALRLQNLNDSFQLYAQLNAQWAPDNLDSSEKFNVGGPYGVRAYAPGSGNGDLGWQSSLELRYALRPTWQLSTFVDHGQARINKHPWTTEKNTLHMSAAGAALAWGGNHHQVSLTAAWPLTSSGVSDNTEKSPRIWIQAARYF